MKNTNTHKAILLISGLIGAGFGAVILFNPIPFYAASGIDLVGKVNLLNEIRAAGGALLACGTLIISGAFVARLTFSATLVAVLMYLAYGLSRIFSMTVDGIPIDELVMVAGMEITVGLICVFSLLRYRKSAS